MSGHSKWSQIKRQKGVADAKRGQLFTKLGRELVVSARAGGGDPDGNARLRMAIARAREANMPMDTIERAIKRGAGAADGPALEEITYEGYGPGGVALLVEAMTDNRNRTVAEVRNVLTRGGGSLGESGCVAWLFDNRGVIVVHGDADTLESTALEAIDAGAEDFAITDDTLEIYSTPSDLEAVRAALIERGMDIESADLAMIPKSTIALEPKEAISTLRMMERLEDLDDVQRVYSNIEMSDALLTEFEASASSTH
ncbi:MAG TPA: YebC/PmpR family DNA-binding transcriptional regulator [Chloroflexota bacterium]|jgi:YebC/PmpR family DNA-binding regulatory protein|nr:YebC/PmpR family DNA-binding transcriptional regulator [Chloroflexota bacterium]